MTPKKILLFLAVVIFLVVSITIIYYLFKANFHATGVFWYGAIAGFAGCLVLLSLILTISLRTTKRMSTKKHGLVFSMLIFSGLVTAILWFFKPGDSDVWWYGAIAGFFSCLVVVLLTVAAYMAYKLLH